MLIEVANNESFAHVYLNESVDVHIVQQAGSRVLLHVLANESADCHIHVEQLGEGCETRIYGLGLVREGKQIVIHTNVEHMVGGGSSEQLVKFVLAAEAHGEFYGQLRIAKDAQQTSALQTNRNLLLSPTAVMRTRPQLEIYADDVKASHGASTGQLDESSLFYMQQRGIDREAAKKLLIGAFVQEILDTVPEGVDFDTTF